MGVVGEIVKEAKGGNGQGEDTQPTASPPTPPPIPAPLPLPLPLPSDDVEIRRLHGSKESMSSSPSSSSGRRMVRALGIWSTVTADAADGGLALLECIEAAVGACVFVVVRTPRRCVRTGACGEHQCQRGKRGTSEHSHVDLPPASQAEPPAVAVTPEIVDRDRPSE
jgi:hypothetical protein